MAQVKIDSLYEFNEMVGFWSGAESVWESLSDHEKAIANDLFEDQDWDSLVQINDFVWFDLPDILEDIAAEEEQNEEEEFAALYTIGAHNYYD